MTSSVQLVRKAKGKEEETGKRRFRWFVPFYKFCKTLRCERRGYEVWSNDCRPRPLVEWCLTICSLPPAINSKFFIAFLGLRKFSLLAFVDWERLELSHELAFSFDLRVGVLSFWELFSCLNLNDRVLQKLQVIIIIIKIWWLTWIMCCLLCSCYEGCLWCLRQSRGVLVLVLILLPSSFYI